MGVASAIEQRAPTVVIYRPVDVSGASHERLLAAGCRLVVADRSERLADALRRTGRVDAVLAASLRGERLGRDALVDQPALRVVAKYTIGVDDIDLDAATELGILVTHAPTEANWGGVAEGTFALILALLKKIEPRNRQVRAGRWRDDALRGVYLGARADGYPGITVGIVGLGRVGRRVADLLAPWKLRLLAADPYVEPEVFERHGAARVPLETLLSESDVVSVHCALTAETERMINAARLGLMQPNAILINTARGRIVDVDAVAAALAAGRLGGAAFDVFPEEPPRPDTPILAADERVILSPHMVAANAGGTLAAAVPWATDAVLAALAGEVPERVFNESAIAPWRTRFAGRSVLPA